jgi:hypothetical protein
MTPRFSLPKIFAAQLHFALTSQRLDTMTPPAFPIRFGSGPFAVNAFPAYCFLLRAEPSFAELAAAIAVCLAAAEQSLEDFSVVILAVRATHGSEPSFFLNDWSPRRHS